MSQYDLYDFLKANAGSWFSGSQIAKALNVERGLVTRGLNKLCYWRLALRRHNETTRCDEFTVGPGRKGGEQR